MPNVTAIDAYIGNDLELDQPVAQGEYANLRDRTDAARDSLLFLHNSLSDRTDGLSDAEVRGMARYLRGIMELLHGNEKS